MYKRSVRGDSIYLEASEYERFVPNSVAAVGMHAAVLPVTVTPYPVLINAELSVFLRNLKVSVTSRSPRESEGFQSQPRPKRPNKNDSLTPLALNKNTTISNTQL